MSTVNSHCLYVYRLRRISLSAIPLLTMALTLFTSHTYAVTTKLTVSHSQDKQEFSEPATGGVQKPNTSNNLKSTTDKRWLLFYYLQPTPDLLSTELHRILPALKNASDKPFTYARYVGAVSQIMKANPDRVMPWIKEFNDADPELGELVLESAWRSKNENAMEYFLDINHAEYASKPPPSVADEPVTTPAGIHFYFGWFFATGDIEPIRQVATVLNDRSWDLGKGQTSNAAAKKLFGNANIGLEVLSRDHDLVVSHMRVLLEDTTLNEEATGWLSMHIDDAEYRKSKSK